MTTQDQPTIRRSELKRKNRIVVVSLILGISIPGLYILFIKPLLPDWIGYTIGFIIVGAVYLICFEFIIPNNLVGIFRRPKVIEDKKEETKDKE